MPHFSKKLNILFVGVLPPHPGWAAISCVQLLDGLADIGHRVRALAPITKKANKEQRRKVTFLVTPAKFVAEASRDLGFDNIEVCTL